MYKNVNKIQYNKKVVLTTYYPQDEHYLLPDYPSYVIYIAV